MTKQQIELSIKTTKLQLSFWDKLAHYGIVVFLLFIPLLSLFFYLKGIFNGTKQAAKTSDFFLLIIPTFLTLIFYKIQSDRLKFKQVFTSLSRQALLNIVEKVGRDLRWYIDPIEDRCIIAKTHPSFFSGSWGEQVTILFDKDRVLVNSICDPDKRSSVVSMGRNKKNENRLIAEIEHASRQQVVLCHGS